MKTILAVGFIVLVVQGQTVALADTTTPNSATTTPYVVVERGANHRVWQGVTVRSNQSGLVTVRTNTYTELATGLHFRLDGQWVETREEISILPNGAGAAATNGQHKVIFPPDIYSGQIELHTTDGQWLRSRVLGLSYYDTANGQSVLLAELTNSVGELHGSNVVIYPNAFAGMAADVRYTYTKAGFEQDIILREQPPSPADYGLNPETTRLEVLTEFFNPPEPGRQARRAQAVDDEILDFGVMKIGRGRAFALGDQSDRRRGVSVKKRWEKLEQRDFLVEDVGFKAIESQLEALPPASVARNHSKVGPDSVLHQVVTQRRLPASRWARQSTNTFQLAGVTAAVRPGYVLDYQIMGGSSNFTFQGDTTYYVADTVNLSGTTTIEGGTVVKFANTNNGGVIVGQVNCQTAPYRPAVFTCKNDNSVGDTIPGSTGNPGTIAPTYITDVAGGNNYHDLRFSYALVAVLEWSSTGTTTFENCQFVHGDVAIYSQEQPLVVRNCLFSDFDWVIETYLAGLTAEHLTVDNCSSYFFSDDGWEQLAFVTNSIFTAVANLSYPAGTAYLTSCLQTNSGATIFQAVGAGSYYLPANSPYRDAGTTNVSSDLLGSLKTKTTHPPMVYSNVVITTNLALAPQAQRDTDTPDLGYHYDPIDYFFGGVSPATNITFNAGTAVGWFEAPGSYPPSSGIALTNDAVAAFNGSQAAPCVFARYATVQEGGNGTWTDKGLEAGINTNTQEGTGNDQPDHPPRVVANFTRFHHLAGDRPSVQDFWQHIVLAANNCEFWSVAQIGYAVRLSLTNCLFFRGGVGNQCDCTPAVNLRNCTMVGGTVYIQHGGQATWPVWIQNCVFDGTTVVMDDYSGGDTNITYCDYNAFLNGANRLAVLGAHDVIVTNSFNWQAGPLGDYYLPTNSPIINGGSTNANVVGLYHYTTQTNQVKETNSVVDIGHHYLAVDGNGNPLDTDGDGTADYLEDTNGNGAYDSASDPGNWQNIDMDNSAASGLRLNYFYDPGGWLLNVSGARRETVQPDSEGNVQQASQ